MSVVPRMLAFAFLPTKLRAGFNIIHRWGNTPAIDVINLAYNEKDASRDFSLAFVGMCLY